MSASDAEHWDRRYRESSHLAALAPTSFLVAHADLLPRRGRALDLACGAGRNALFLAERGLETTGVDISLEGLALARRSAEKRGLTVDFRQADLDGLPIERGAWDVIACVHFLDRGLAPRMVEGLRPGGVLYFETFTRDQLAFPEAHPRREAFLLAPNEALRLFSGLHIIHHEEKVQHLASGERAVLAALFAEKR